MKETPDVFIGTYVDYTQQDSTDPSKYTWGRFQGLQGPDGEQGIPGENGLDGRTSYLHIKYSNDGGATFTGNNGEDVGDYIGQYTDFIQQDSSDPKAYKWSKIKGETGPQGPTGPTGSQGVPGTSQYFHVKYSANPDGNPMVDTPNTYIGTVVNSNSTPPSSYTAYKWVRLEGAQGPQGSQGIPGVSGSDGRTSYLHVKYSNDNGATFTSNGGEDVGDYLGQYVDFTQADSTKTSDYKWSKIKGEQGPQGDRGIQGLQGLQGEKGEQGIPGTPGSDGRTSYFHVKYSDYPNGANMSETGGNYIGTYVDFTATDSTDPSKYTWVETKGAQGPKGEQGIPGTNGTNGQTSYLHIAYADNSTGTLNFSTTDSTNKLYIGQYTDFSILDSSNPSDYKWTRIKGEQGEQGERGPQGPVGATGPTGSQGVSGIPGVSIEIRYCRGTATEPTGTTNPSSTRDPDGWTTTVPQTNVAYQYIWFIQAQIVYSSNSDTTGSVRGTWSTPSRLSGTNGINGATGPQGLPGSKGQIIYPAGVYIPNTAYRTTETEAPYVYDTADENYYVLNKVGLWQSQDLPSEDTSGAWVKLDAFEAIYAKIGIIANGLIGSAVFNGDYMFSQQGIDARGLPSTAYNLFDPANPTGGAFTPNIMFNFRTGAGHLASGKTQFDAYGNMKLSNVMLDGNIVKTYSKVYMDDPYIRTLYSTIVQGDATLDFQWQLNQETRAHIEMGGYYEGSIINGTGYDQRITDVTVYAPGDSRFNDEGDISTVICTEIILGPNCVFDYTFNCGTASQSTVTGPMYVRNADDFVITRIGNTIFLTSKGIAASVPINCIYSGMLTIQGTSNNDIFLQGLGISGITVQKSMVNYGNNKLMISLSVTRPYLSIGTMYADAQQVFGPDSYYTSAPWCTVRSILKRFTEANSAILLPIYVDTGGAAISANTKILVNFNIYIVEGNRGI